MTDVTLLHGDCLELMPTLPAQSVAMVFSDLPYGATSNTWDEHLPIHNLWALFERIVTADACFIFTCSMRFAVTLIASKPRWFRHDLVWNKLRASSFTNAKLSPMRSHEHILVFAPQKTVYNPQMTDGRCIKVSRTGDGISTNFGIKPSSKGSGQFRYPLSVCSYKRDDMRNKQGHPTQKPVALLEWLIKTYTNPGDTVLDPVAGSGTTAIAAMRTGRKVICIEKDATYFAAMTKRVADERVKMQQAEMAL